MNAKILEREPIAESSITAALKCLLSGAVQGVGMRPALLLLAQELKVTGWVRNVACGVELHVEGKKANVDRFLEKLVEPCRLPTIPIVQKVQYVKSENYKRFLIRPNDHTSFMPTVEIPLDRVACKRCREEYNYFADRRYRYPLISCSECGPRYTILETMPFDRQATAMKEFSTCITCQSEYDDIRNRRLHSQGICCPNCGPTVTGIVEGIEALSRGEVIAIRGIGGYQLICSAISDEALRSLRQIKRRSRKPFAIMVSQGWLNSSVIDERLRNRLLADDGPIVIVPGHEFYGPSIQLMSDHISPHLGSLGIMLPTTLLHEELIEACGPLVVTSANLAGEPIAREYRDLERLTNHNGSVDIAVIDHDRPIVNRIDDSVLNYCNGRFSTIRPGRGMAPKFWNLKDLGFNSTVNGPYPHILAVGSEQKVALAWCNGQQIVMGHFLGDIDSMPMRNYFDECVQNVRQLCCFEPSIVVHDLHPDYYTSRWASEKTNCENLVGIAVQHHYAHLLSALIEPRWLGRKVLGFVWDGTGVGDDGIIWGGECFVADRSHYQRVGSLLPFVLPGGDAAIREPWRIAYGLLRLSHCDYPYERFGQLPIQSMDTMLSNELHTIRTSSVGRLFDGVAALILDKSLSHSPVTYEGEFAQILEEISDRHESGCYDMPLVQLKESPGSECLRLDWRCMIRQIVDDQIRGVPAAGIAMKFHRTLANTILNIARLYDDLPIVLSGGCFQNKLLLELIAQTEIERMREVAWPGVVPVNDSGLALGQVVAALTQAEHGISGK